MAPRSSLEELEKEFEGRWRRRRRLKRGAMVILVIVFILSLWPWTCSGPGGQKPGGPLVAKEQPERLDATPRFSREAFANKDQLRVAWGRELSDGVRDLGAMAGDCLVDAEQVEWHFLFNPKTGQIRHLRFTNPAGDGLDPEKSSCLEPLLPDRVSLRGSYPAGWFPVRITLLSPGRPQGEESDPYEPSPDG